VVRSGGGVIPTRVCTSSISVAGRVAVGCRSGRSSVMCSSGLRHRRLEERFIVSSRFDEFLVQGHKIILKKTCQRMPPGQLTILSHTFLLRVFANQLNELWSYCERRMV